MLGKYRVISTLGSGQFSTVYLAEHLKLKVLRAIKCIPKNLAAKSSLSLEDGFLTEAYLLKNLNHPGIPLIYDIDEDHEFIYMIVEFIQGESLDAFLLQQKNISQDLIFHIGIQLCDILDYLHHLSPYPILYQDLKPEHIILCGNQVKLIDFGIASFFTGSGEIFQLYGTDGFVAPEALNGLPVTPMSDIYSLGKVLETMANAVTPKCSSQLLHILQQAAATNPGERYSSACSLKSALECAKNNVRRTSSHLIRNIAVISNRSGAGATHFSISLVSAFNKQGFSSLYMAKPQSDTLDAMKENNIRIKEQNGIYQYEYFKGIPFYGDGIEPFDFSDYCVIKDFGASFENLFELDACDIIFCILSGSDWDCSSAITLGKHLSSFQQTVFICNYQNRKAARKFANAFKKKVFCFPFDENPYRVTHEKERLFSSILSQKGGNHHFSF